MFEFPLTLRLLPCGPQGKREAIAEAGALKVNAPEAPVLSQQLGVRPRVKLDESPVSCGVGGVLHARQA